MPADDLLHTAPSPAFLGVFREASGGTDVLPFDAFMQLALYHPQLGYYRKDRLRVGYAPGTDFYTATTSGSLFGELIAAACSELLGAHRAREYTFVEIGAEPGRAVLDGVAHPFRDCLAIGLGGQLSLTGKCVVFSNELFDAQPFRRFVFANGQWRELGVKLENGHLVEAPLALGTTPSQLPATAPEGYHVDLPLAASALLDEILAQPWTGLFVACDYGKSWLELIEAAPAGTARAYHRHTQSNALLARPGEQDLTCHVCWDWLSDGLLRAGFSSPRVESQEAFFIHHAGAMIAATSAVEATRLSPRKLALMQLLHPAHLGQKFQVLWGVRE
jgi:SAM-dependent MidA family methyltransferase